jgi:regulator of sirC expression with transglutaminase-like and TPR domain
VRAVEATERFAAVMSGPEAELALDEAALLIAAHARPELDVGRQRARLDELASGVTTPNLDGLCHYLFGSQRFAGNVTDYYDPQNSYLDRVLDRHLGIPITLAVLLIEVGRRIGVVLHGVNMPGHFLVGDAAAPDVLVDAFAGGTRLDRRGAEALFRDRQGAASPFLPDFLRPVSPHRIIARMLANLDVIATARADRFMLAWVVRLRAAVPHAGPAMQRRLAAALAECGRLDEAAEVLERLARAGHPGSAGDRTAALRLRARLS